MIPLTAAHLALAKKLEKYSGEATAEELKSSYVRIEPLIRHKYVRVTSEKGVPVYVLTDAGLKWIESNVVPKAPPKTASKVRRTRPRRRV